MLPPGEVIFHLRHSAIGRSTHRPGTAGAHLRYIGRRGAEWHTNQHQTPEEAAAALAIVEAGLRKNGRILDKVSAALPRCLTPAQQRALALAFARRICEQAPGGVVARDPLGGREPPPSPCLARPRSRDGRRRVAQQQQGQHRAPAAGLGGRPQRGPAGRR